ncbi:MAG: STAS/SEC14 domain-containing protein [Bacteroidia bacterium]
MIKEIENLPKNVVGFSYIGKVTGKDYESVVFPAVEKATKGKKKINILITFEKSFDKISLKAMVDDSIVGLKYIKSWKKIAIVSDHNKINHLIKAFSFLVPAEIKIFTLSKIDKALVWILKK